MKNIVYALIYLIHFVLREDLNFGATEIESFLVWTALNSQIRLFCYVIMGAQLCNTFLANSGPILPQRKLFLTACYLSNTHLEMK